MENTRSPGSQGWNKSLVEQNTGNSNVDITCGRWKGLVSGDEKSEPFLNN